MCPLHSRYSKRPRTSSQPRVLKRFPKSPAVPHAARVSLVHRSGMALASEHGGMCPVFVELNCEMDFLVRNASVVANLNLVANSEHNRHVARSRV